IHAWPPRRTTRACPKGHPCAPKRSRAGANRGDSRFVHVVSILPSEDTRMATIVIDPGHGGSMDAGRSTWRGVVGAGGGVEKDVNLRLAARVRAHPGKSAGLTRAARRK